MILGTLGNIYDPIRGLMKSKLFLNYNKMLWALKKILIIKCTAEFLEVV